MPKPPGFGRLRFGRYSRRPNCFRRSNSLCVTYVAAHIAVNLDAGDAVDQRYATTNHQSFWRFRARRTAHKGLAAPLLAHKRFESGDTLRLFNQPCPSLGITDLQEGLHEPVTLLRCRFGHVTTTAMAGCTVFRLKTGCMLSSNRPDFVVSHVQGSPPRMRAIAAKTAGMSKPQDDAEHLADLTKQLPRWLSAVVLNSAPIC